MHNDNKTEMQASLNVILIGSGQCSVLIYRSLRGYSPFQLSALVIFMALDNWNEAENN